MHLYRPLFELLLRAFPEPFRHRFGQGMREAFEAAYHEQRDNPARLCRVVLRTAVDMVWAGLCERVRPTTGRRHTAAPTKRWTAMRFSSLDITLGFRMLVKHPALTTVTVFALAIGIPVGLAPTHLANALEAPLPVPDGDRIRLLRHWNQATAAQDATTFYDFLQWRDGLTTFESLGAARGSMYNISSEDGLAPPVWGAEVTASTFAILRVGPYLGRTLGAADEGLGAPSVAVIGYDLWQSRLGGNPQVIGHDLRIGGVPHTVVGVMPKGFLFPVNQQLWVPLRERPAAEPAEGFPLIVFGRLQERSTEEGAQAELSTLGRRRALDFPATYTWLNPEVVAYSFVVTGGLPKGGIKAQPEFYISQIVTLVLLMVACTNVGMLVFARTAARSGELAVRTALGASRSRIITQIFTESLVLAVLASGLGLLLLHWLPARVIAAATTASLPFWIDLGVGRDTLGWTLVLAVFSAAVVGILPALRVTGRTIQGNIQRAQSSRSGFRFGGTSSALIIADVAIAVATVGLAAGLSHHLSQSWDDRNTIGIEASRFLSAELRFPRMDPGSLDPASHRLELRRRSADRQRALVERLEAEPGVRGVAVASALPRMDHPSRTIEVEGHDDADGVRAARVRTASVDLNYFTALDHPIRSGRNFEANDVRENASAVIVNTTFVDQVLGGRNPIGTRIRYTARSANGEPGRWHEIVGVVGRLGMHVLNPDGDAGIYHPLTPGSDSVHLAIHLGPDPESFIPRLRALANEVDPTASVGSPVALSKVFEGDWYLMAGLTLGGGALVGLLLALAASGIYAIMSFAVTERTREIGIRAALGAKRSSIAFTVARRAFAQIGIGALLGTPVAWRVFFELQRDAGSSYSTIATVVAALVPGVVVMIVVGLVACTAPTLRALRVTPIEALRS